VSSPVLTRLLIELAWWRWVLRCLWGARLVCPDPLCEACRRSKRVEQRRRDTQRCSASDSLDDR
jgi:hypothetical protein